MSNGDLAILGAEPRFKEPLHVGRPNIPDRARLEARFKEILDSKWLTNYGKFVKEFENALADYVGVRHCIPVCNGTIGLELALKACGVTGEVIVPSFTFIATAHAVKWCGLEPTFADVETDTHLLSPAAVEAAITSKTKAILGVHTWGTACHPEELQRIADKHGLTLLFDAAHAFGCTHGGQMIGNCGRAEVFSFHATKFLNSFEGGAIATNDDELAHRIRRMKNFGFAGVDMVDSVGTNGKMTEVSAAMGLTSLEEIEGVIALNAKNHALYSSLIGQIPGLRVFQYDSAEKTNYQYVVVEVDSSCALSRDELVEVLWREKVLARRYFYPGCHRSEPYRSSGRAWTLPNTEDLSGRVMILPTGTAVEAKDMNEIADILKTAIACHTEVRKALKK
jgi:dTDP-4-amino-4,6-dideoxygalactose transaminase